jgi:hypothetical protein
VRLAWEHSLEVGYSANMEDLIVLVADKDMELTMMALLNRHQSFNIREINFKIVPHINRDNGCFQEAEKFLQIYQEEYTHALVLFDYHGSGPDVRTNKLSHKETVQDVENRLQKSGWKAANAKAIVSNPELEIWLWTDSTHHLEDLLSWKDSKKPKEYLQSTTKHWITGELKPQFPKDAFDAILNHTGKRRSSDWFKKLAERMSFKNCQDPNFLKLKEVLVNWFGIPSTTSITE